MWHHLGISLPHEDGFSKVNNYYIKSTCYGVCNDDGVNTNEIWMNGDWFYSVSYTNFGYCGKATQRLPPDSIAWWKLPNLKVEILEMDADLCGHISI